ncbi:MAG: C40 family peptidase [Thermomicrobiales bacterium]
MVTGNDVRGNDRVLNRRRAIIMATVLALGVPTFADAARRKNHEKNRDKDKKKDKGKNHKNRSKGKKQKSGNGHDVVRVAKKHKGARYKWGGTSPRGFDCSGFCWYVYQKATGLDIGQGVEAQWKAGRSVGRGSLKPGDVVFFKNTFERGLSHNGIYIGGDDFIHAENERTGVVISSLKSDYYDDHYAGARRLL